MSRISSALLLTKLSSIPLSSPTPFVATGVRAEQARTKYLMNDIPRGTSRSKLSHSRFFPIHVRNRVAVPPCLLESEVQFRPDLADSRLDFEVFIAVIEFSDTPRWLQELNDDPCGFSKQTLLGTLAMGGH